MRFVLVLLALVGCAGEPPGECVDDGDCAGLAVCSEARTCEPVQCLDSLQCPIGTFCMPEFKQCFTGCGADEDCGAGEVCDVAVNQCAPAACTDPVLDCYYGEICDADAGCSILPGLCEPCADGACQQAGGKCDWFNAGSMCLPLCDPADANAPRGFECEAQGEVHRWTGDCDKVYPL